MAAFTAVLSGVVVFEAYMVARVMSVVALVASTGKNLAVEFMVTRRSVTEPRGAEVNMSEAIVVFGIETCVVSPATLLELPASAVLTVRSVLLTVLVVGIAVVLGMGVFVRTMSEAVIEFVVLVLKICVVIVAVSAVVAFSVAAVGDSIPVVFMCEEVAKSSVPVIAVSVVAEKVSTTGIVVVLTSTVAGLSLLGVPVMSLIPVTTLVILTLGVLSVPMDVVLEARVGVSGG